MLVGLALGAPGLPGAREPIPSAWPRSRAKSWKASMRRVAVCCVAPGSVKVTLTLGMPPAAGDSGMVRVTFWSGLVPIAFVSLPFVPTVPATSAWFLIAHWALVGFWRVTARQ